MYRSDRQVGGKYGTCHLLRGCAFILFNAFIYGNFVAINAEFMTRRKLIMIIKYDNSRNRINSAIQYCYQILKDMIIYYLHLLTLVTAT